MKRPVIGALLSALVFPGVGQWYLQRRILALVFALPALAAGYVYLNHVLDEATALAGQVLSGTLDPAAVAAKAEAQPTPLSITVCGAVFLLCWVGSVLEALLAKRER